MAGQKCIALVLVALVLALAGCGGSAKSTTTTTSNQSPAAALGHNMAQSMAMFGLSPQAVVRRYGDTFRKLSKAQQRVAMKAAARDFTTQGKTPLTEGKQGAVLRALGLIRDGGAAP